MKKKDYENKMLKGFENKQLKINAPLKNLKPGAIINIQTDKDGVPLERYWRDRLRDSEIDNCVEIVDAKKKERKESDK